MILISINKFEIKLLSYLQEKKELDLNDCEDIFLKSFSTIKRNILNLNDYLPSDKQLIIEKNIVKSNLVYDDYINFVKGLAIFDYISSPKERVSLMIIYGFFNSHLNMTGLYKKIGISLTTKKKDSKALSEKLESLNLETHIIPRKGISISGDELNFRILVTSLLKDYLEINTSDNFITRIANNPFENMIANYYLAKAHEEIEVAKKILQDFIDKHDFHFSYSSKKFIYIYISIALTRLSQGFHLNRPFDISIKVKDFKLIEDEKENTFLNYLISAMDHTSVVFNELDDTLSTLTTELISNVQSRILTSVSHDKKLFKSVYYYLHKCIIRSTFNFYFYDNKLDDTEKYFSNLFSILSSSVENIEKQYGFTFSNLQLSNLTLLFSSFILKNKLVGRNSKNIVIVTNSSMEKIDFFLENLKLHVDIAKTHIIHINELHVINDLNYDFIITFSNRISTLLSKDNFPSLKLNFYLTKDDISLLHSVGFSTSKRKISSAHFVEEIDGMTKDELKEFLVEKYSNNFL